MVTKEAALDFARRRDLPPPSWWNDTTGAPKAKATNTRLGTEPRVRKRGPKPSKVEWVKSQMRREITEGRQTVESLRDSLEKNLADKYDVARDTARKARTAVLFEFVEDSNRDK